LQQGWQVFDNGNFNSDCPKKCYISKIKTLTGKKYNYVEKYSQELFLQIDDQVLKE